MFREDEDMMLHLPADDDVEALLQWYAKAEELHFDLELKLETGKREHISVRRPRKSKLKKIDSWFSGGYITKGGEAMLLHPLLSHGRAVLLTV